MLSTVDTISLFAMSVASRMPQGLWGYRNTQPCGLCDTGTGARQSTKGQSAPMPEPVPAAERLPAAASSAGHGHRRFRQGAHHARAKRWLACRQASCRRSAPPDDGTARMTPRSTAGAHVAQCHRRPGLGSWSCAHAGEDILTRRIVEAAPVAAGCRLAFERARRRMYPSPRKSIKPPLQVVRRWP
jgi:hypothetical protein